MMPDEITVEIGDVDGDTVLVSISTPLGPVEILGAVRIEGRRLAIDHAHVGGPGPGRLGRKGLNAICAKLLVEADVDEIVIQGGARTTGRNPGRRPRPFRYPG